MRRRLLFQMFFTRYQRSVRWCLVEGGIVRARANSSHEAHMLRFGNPWIIQTEQMLRRCPRSYTPRSFRETPGWDLSGATPRSQ